MVAKPDIVIAISVAKLPTTPIEGEPESQISLIRSAKNTDSQKTVIVQQGALDGIAHDKWQPERKLGENNNQDDELLGRHVKFAQKGNQPLGQMQNGHHMPEKNGLHNDDQDHGCGAQAR